MASRVVRCKRVRIRLVRRKPLKRRSKRAKLRKKPHQSVRVARLLITNSLPEHSTNFKNVSVVRLATSSTEKLVKTKNKKGRSSPQVAFLHKQQQSWHREAGKDNIGAIEDTELSHTKTTKVAPTSPISLPNQSHRLVSDSKQRSNRKSVKPADDRTSKVLPPPSSLSILQSFLILSPFNKNSAVHPDNEQRERSLSDNDRRKRRRRRRLCTSWKHYLACILLTLLIACIVLSIAIPLTVSKSTYKTTSTTSASTAIVHSTICTTINYTLCSTTMFQNLNTGFTTSSSWTPESCCYVARTVNQITFQFTIQDDSSGYWLLDDVSAEQGNGELVSNGGFEYNLTNWTLTVYPNATSSTAVLFLSGDQHTGNAYLYGASANAPVYIKQTFSIIPGKNVLIRFWWNYFPPFGGGTGTSALTATLL